MWGKWEDVKSEYEAKVNDPWDWVTHFENAVARYTGAKHAIACDSASNAIKLCLNYIKEAKSIKIAKGSKMHIPANTYVSVPNQLILEGFIPVFEQKEWHRHYKIGTSGIIDAAGNADSRRFLFGVLYGGRYLDASARHGAHALRAQFSSADGGC